MSGDATNYRQCTPDYSHPVFKVSLLCISTLIYDNCIRFHTCTCRKVYWADINGSHIPLLLLIIISVVCYALMFCIGACTTCRGGHWVERYRQGQEPAALSNMVRRQVHCLWCELAQGFHVRAIPTGARGKNAATYCCWNCFEGGEGKTCKGWASCYKWW
jgi:hypothetical protein